MNRRAVWVGRALAVLGLAALIFGVVRAAFWGLVAAAGGFVCAVGLTFAPLMRSWVTRAPGSRPSDFSHMLDLLRRSYGAQAAWAVGLASGDLEVSGGADTLPQTLRRGSAIAQLASVDGRAHVARETDGTYVAVGDFPFGAGVLLGSPDVDAATTAALAEELRRLVAAMRVSEPDGRAERGDLVVRQLAALAAGAQTLEGVAKAGAEVAEQVLQRPALVIVQSSAPGGAPLQVLGVSRSGDQRLVRVTVPHDAPAARAVLSGVRIVTQSQNDILGGALPDRRRHERAGTAVPLLDGHVAIGALVITGASLDPDAVQAEQLQRLVQELGSRLAAARAVHEAEQRATLDPLTGLKNRRELERRIAKQRQGSSPEAGPTSLIYLDLDRFKALNDSLGHAAGDAALRHVAALLNGLIRDRDLAVRIGGEEFAIWMPDTPLAHAVDAAERIRAAIAATSWRWNGTPYPLAASFGVAGIPESVGDVNNLQSAADAALYRAKAQGRNRVEKATRAP
ncbi:MAG TPA: GGDEF domain-containing protein [Gemmatimonadales bacterium]|nr:GGDEF domain-containing protein [Gemmatimonadales bacterium]